MNRRTTTALVLLLLLLLMLTAQAVTRQPLVKDESRAGRASKERPYRQPPRDDPRTHIPSDDTAPAIPETEAEVSTEEQKTIISMLNQSGWLNKGVYEVFGEVQNTGQLTGKNIGFHIIFKDGAFNTLAEIDAPADKTVLRPGEKSTFKILLPDKAKSAKVGSYIILPQGTPQ